jgi:hypothetical protein
MSSTPWDVDGRAARIARVIEQYKLAKQRRLLRRAMRQWRRAEAHQQVVNLEMPPERVH